MRSRTGSPRCRGAKAHTQSALPRETYDNRSRWSLCLLLILCYSPVTKVFWKGEFEGKNLFFKKGFPLFLFQLEKTSLTGSQLAGDRKFFQGRTKSANFLATKNAKNAKKSLKLRELCVLCVRFLLFSSSN